MDFILIAIFASVFVLAMFWFVAQTIGKLRVVKHSPTLSDIQDLINPQMADKRNLDLEQNPSKSEGLSESVRALADAGEKISATKLHRDDAGVSLMEAKRMVEAYLRNRKNEP